MTPLVVDASVGDLLVFEGRPIIPRAVQIAISCGRTAYDSLYLALAEQEHTQVVTADRRLYNGVRGSAWETRVVWIEDVP